MIGVGVIGCGYWGPNLVRNFSKAAGSQVVALCDQRFERAARLASEYGIGCVLDRHDDIARSKDVDLVVIATPCFTHYELALDAIRAGKHVLVMKPLTTAVCHAEELVYEAQKQGVMLAVDHTFVYTGAVRKMRQLMDAGELGDVYYIDSVRINLGLFQSDVNVVWDLAPHDISIMDYLLDGQTPAEVSTVGMSHGNSPTENIAYLTMRFGHRTLAHVHVNWLAPAKVRQMIIGGSKKMLIYDDVEPSEKVRIYDKGVSISSTNGNGNGKDQYESLVQYRSGDMYAPKIDMREALTTEVEHLLECIERGSQPIADGEAGLRVVRILEAAQQSIDESGVPVGIQVDAGERSPDSRLTDSRLGVEESRVS